jgi:uncharacterized protein YbjT (DUF2867 family)
MTDRVERGVVLVTGATGRQGGAAVEHLLDAGFPVRALVRNPRKPRAKELAEKGAELTRGDLDDPGSLEPALEGVYGVFSVQNFFQAGYEGEIRQGTLLADAAKAAGVSHFVYSSVGSAHRKTGISHFDSKRHVEDHIRSVGLPYTILRPVFFMHNWDGMRERILDGAFPSPLSLDTALQQLAVEDLGAFVAEAFANPSNWLGGEVDLAGDELTMPEVALTFARVIGKEVSHVQTGWDEFRHAAGEEVFEMYRWFEDEGYEADLAALRAAGHRLTPLEYYLRQHGWEGAANGG